MTASTDNSPANDDSQQSTMAKMTPEEAWSNILESNFDAATKDCLTTLLKIIDNLLSRPNEPKVRSLRCAKVLNMTYRVPIVAANSRRLSILSQHPVSLSLLFSTKYHVPGLTHYLAMHVPKPFDRLSLTRRRKLPSPLLPSPLPLNSSFPLATAASEIQRAHSYIHDLRPVSLPYSGHLYSMNSILFVPFSLIGTFGRKKGGRRTDVQRGGATDAA